MSLRKFDKGITCCCVIIDGEEKGGGAPYPLGSINDPLCYLGFAETDCQRLMAGQQRGSGLPPWGLWASQPAKESTPVTSSPAKDWLYLAWTTTVFVMAPPTVEWNPLLRTKGSWTGAQASSAIAVSSPRSVQIKKKHTCPLAPNIQMWLAREQSQPPKYYRKFLLKVWMGMERKWGERLSIINHSWNSHSTPLPMCHSPVLAQVCEGNYQTGSLGKGCRVAVAFCCSEINT